MACINIIIALDLVIIAYFAHFIFIKLNEKLYNYREFERFERTKPILYTKKIRSFHEYRFGINADKNSSSLSRKNKFNRDYS
jgi:hypothetical protein